MEESERLTFNGSQWLFTLTYGVKKSKDFEAFEKKLKKKSILDILVEGGEAERAAAKLINVKSELDGLLHTEVVITPLGIDDVVPIIGLIEKIDLNRGAIVLLQDGENTTIPFCEISPHSVYGFEITPVVTMQAEKEYKF